MRGSFAKKKTQGYLKLTGSLDTLFDTFAKQHFKVR
jgi:hypothetical protein